MSRRLRLVWATLALTAVAAGCSADGSEVTVEERTERTESELVEAGSSPEVAACVVRLARDELRVGAIDPVALDELTLACGRAQAVLDGDMSETTEPDAVAFVDGPNTLGDDPRLDSLWRSCEEGSGAACDALFEQAPLGSDYERFGVSCGDRDALLRCSELDEPDP